ncbi:unnamed protein product [Didymodactylos carnosus]|uniref:CCHC-type domain-containing protein n=1 Tax=Didymodactylos carnosus TaxID=1234261 RepID=A0A8S2EWG4_9BILA|nr:unnamed protein product [Didymodactylos carnosus]CAF4138961.1 unnamed protein product [Didymodactylos carnosus]
MNNSTTTTSEQATMAVQQVYGDQQDLINNEMSQDGSPQAMFSDAHGPNTAAGIPVSASTPRSLPLNSNRPNATSVAEKRPRGNDTNESEENVNDNEFTTVTRNNKKKQNVNNTNSSRNQRTTNNHQQKPKQNDPQNYPYHLPRTFYSSNSNRNGNQLQTYVRNSDMNQNQYNYRNNVVRQQQQRSPYLQQNSGVSWQAERFAETRYPFSPYVLRFTTDVNEKDLIKQVVKYAKDEKQFDIQLIAHRKSQVNCPPNACDILLFVETTESFAFLLSRDNWPEKISNMNFELKTPSIPPQLSVVVQNVGFDVNLDEFAGTVKEGLSEAVNFVRLKNRAQRDLKLVKIEFNSATTRSYLLEKKFITVDYIRYPVVEYLALARVLVCSRCMGIGHFQKNCPQKDKVTCKVCGELCDDMNNHQCSGVVKCVHCQQDHRSNATKCPIIKDYRAALTKTLIAHQSSAVYGVAYNSTNFPQLSGRPMTTSTPVAPWAQLQRQPPQAQNMPDDSQTNMMALLVQHITDEANKTRECHETFMEEMSKRDEAQKQKIQLLEERMATMTRQNSQLKQDYGMTSKQLDEKNAELHEVIKKQSAVLLSMWSYFCASATASPQREQERAITQGNVNQLMEWCHKNGVLGSSTIWNTGT